MSLSSFLGIDSQISVASWQFLFLEIDLKFCWQQFGNEKQQTSRNLWQQIITSARLAQGLAFSQECPQNKVNKK